MVTGMKRVVSALLVIVAVAQLSSCGGGGGAVAIPGSSTRRFGSLLFGLTTPRSAYAIGEPVTLSFSVTNLSRQAVTALFIGCGSSFLVDKGSQQVFSTTCAIQEGFSVTFMPGETKTFPDSWDQRDSNAPANQVAAGEYSIVAWLPAVSVDSRNFTFAEARQDLASGPVQITIGP